MFSNESTPNDGDTNETPSGTHEASPQQAAATAASEARADVVNDASAGDSAASEASANEAAKEAAAPASKPDADDDDDARSHGDVDFGQLLDQFDHPPRYDGTEPFGEHVRGVAKRHELRAVVEHEHVRELVRRVGRRGIGRRHDGEVSAGDDRRQTGPHFALARPLVLISGRRLPESPPARRGKVGPPRRHEQHPGGLHQAA